MVGVIGIIGCMAIASAVVSAALAVVSLGYSIHSSNEQEEQVEKMDAKNAERQKQAEIMQKAKQRKSLIRAAQMAASGSLLDRIQTSRASREAKKAREKARNGEYRASVVPRPPRDYGSPTTSGGSWS